MLKDKLYPMSRLYHALHLRYWLLLGTWLAVIFVFSAQPTWTSSRPWMHVTLIRKSAHALEFALLTALVWKVLKYVEEHSLGLEKVARYRVWIAFLFPFLYAISDELHQYFVPHRKGKVTDVAIDAVGVLFAWMLLWLWERRQSLTPQKAYVRTQDRRGCQKSSRYGR